MLEKCWELHRVHKRLIPVFILASEREKLVKKDIRFFLNLTAPTRQQNVYLKSLVQTLANITEKLVSKISCLQSEMPLVGNPFIVNKTVMLGTDIRTM